MFKRYLFSEEDVNSALLNIYNYEAKTHFLVQLLQKGNRILSEKKQSLLKKISPERVIDPTYLESFIEKVRSNSELAESLRHSLVAQLYTAQGNIEEAVGEYCSAGDVAAAIEIGLAEGRPESIEKHLKSPDDFLHAARQAYRHGQRTLAEKYYSNALDALLNKAEAPELKQQQTQHLQDTINMIKKLLDEILPSDTEDDAAAARGPQLLDIQTALMDLMPMLEGNDADIWHGFDIAKEAFRKTGGRDFGEKVLYYASYVMNQLKSSKPPRYALLTARTAARLMQDKNDSYYQTALKNYRETANYFSRRGNHLAAGKLLEQIAKIFSDAAARDEAVEQYLKGHLYIEAAAAEWDRGKHEEAITILDRPGFRKYAVDYLFMEREPNINRILFLLEKDGDFEKAGEIAQSYPGGEDRVKIYEKVLAILSD